MADQLIKLCPFCGCEPEPIRRIKPRLEENIMGEFAMSKESFMIICRSGPKNNYQHHACSASGSTEEEVIANWNKRGKNG